MSSRDKVVRVALVGGPMYDPLYAAIPEFERETGLIVEVAVKLPHPELNAHVKRVFEAGEADIDLLSTHTKYAPSQAEWLSGLDEVVPRDLVADLLPRAAELSRIEGQLLQVPRNLDVRLLHYRRDLFEDPAVREPFERDFGEPLRVPETWIELAQVASVLMPGFHREIREIGERNVLPDLPDLPVTRPFYGFLFPGRDSGLFGTFYELLVGAGGELFDGALRPAFDSPAGEWAAGLIAELHHARRVTPRELAGWHYDEISTAFRDGHAAMVCDWPGSYHLYTNPDSCRVAAHVGLALLPRGPAGIRAAYAGCHSFAIPRRAANREGGVALLRFLTSFESQLGEARRGAIPCRASALQRVREEDAANPDAARRWELLAETERFMIIPQRFAAYPRCEDAIWHAVQRAMEGDWSPAEAVHRATADIQSIVGGAPVTSR